MKIVKALVALKMARSNAEANRFVKQGSVLVGNCKQDCTLRVNGKCICGGWKKATNPTEEIFWPTCLRIKDGSWRLMTREDGKTGFDQLPGCGMVPSQVRFDVNVKGPFIDEVQIKFWKCVFAVRDFFKKAGK